MDFTVRDTHENGWDEMLTTQHKLLENILYSHALYRCLRLLNDKVIQKDILPLSINNNRMETLLSVVIIVAVGLSTAHVSRLPRSFEKVKNCRQGVGTLLLGFCSSLSLSSFTTLTACTLLILIASWFRAGKYTTEKRQHGWKHA